MNNCLEIVVSDVSRASHLSREDLRSFIAKVEEQMRSLPQIQINIETIHHFSKGVYAREIRIPKGALLVGKIHKHENLNIMSAGDASVLSIDGAQRIKAPFTVVSSAGVKRVIFAHEDTVWTTIHGTDERDIEKIEDDFIAKDYAELPGVEQNILEIRGE